MQKGSIFYLKCPVELHINMKAVASWFNISKKTTKSIVVMIYLNINTTLITEGLFMENKNLY